MEISLQYTYPPFFLTSYSLRETIYARGKEELSCDWYMKDTKYPFGKLISFWHLLKKKRQEWKINICSFVKASKEDGDD